MAHGGAVITVVAEATTIRVAPVLPTSEPMSLQYLLFTLKKLFEIQSLKHNN
jgi:hypothetical protein